VGASRTSIRSRNKVIVICDAFRWPGRMRC
jgi:hypothetical protein